eukprot:scaffold1052_cov50-Attheya_sp.AAC.4
MGMCRSLEREAGVACRTLNLDLDFGRRRFACGLHGWVRIFHFADSSGFAFLVGYEAVSSSVAWRGVAWRLAFTVGLFLSRLLLSDISLFISALSLSVALHSGRGEATVFSRADFINLGSVDAASSGGSNAGIFVAIRVLSLFRLYPSFGSLSASLYSGRGDSFCQVDLIYKFGNQWGQSMRLLLAVRTLGALLEMGGCFL